MNNGSPTITGDGPDAVLLRLVRRLRLPYSPSFVAARITSHPQPTSLLALVEVGAQLGMKITAGRTVESALDRLDLPAVVHLEGNGGRGGFAVLEATPAGGVVLWDSTAGRERIDRETFRQQWSGVVALVERDGSRQVAEAGYRRRRLLDRLSPRSVLPTPAGRGVAGVGLRVTLGTLLGVLLAIAVAGHPAGTRTTAAGLGTVTVLGLVVAIALAAAGTGSGTVPGCPRGRIIDCHSVLTSPFSRVGGIPLSEIGVAFFGAVTLLLAGAALRPQSSAVWAAAGAAYMAGLPAVAVLVWLQVAMRQVCTWCLAVHVLIVSGAVMSREFVLDLWSLPSLAAVLLLGVFGCLLLFAVVPHLTHAPRLRALLARHQRLSSSPYATLAHLLTEPPTPVRGAACGVQLEGAAGAHEVVVFVHPTCPQCGPMVRQAESLAGAGAAEVFVVITPRDGSVAERRACAVIVAAGLAVGPGALLDAYEFAKQHYRSLLEGNPVELVADHLTVDAETLRSRLEQAEATVCTAAAFADGHVEGTPSVFVDSRLFPYRAPLSHLEFLLERHSDLLAAGGQPRQEVTW